MKSLSYFWKVPLLAALIALAVGAPASADVQALSIDENATLSPGHQAIIVSGTITCTAGDIWAVSSARVIQGQRSGFASLFSQTCTGESQAWSLPVVSNQGLFHRGRASAGISVIWSGATFGGVQSTVSSPCAEHGKASPLGTSDARMDDALRGGTMYRISLAVATAIAGLAFAAPSAVAQAGFNGPNCQGGFISQNVTGIGFAELAANFGVSVQEGQDLIQAGCAGITTNAPRCEQGQGQAAQAALERGDLALYMSHLGALFNCFTGESPGGPL